MSIHLSGCVYCASQKLVAVRFFQEVTFSSFQRNVSSLNVQTEMTSLAGTFLQVYYGLIIWDNVCQYGTLEYRVTNI
jgi:hypothetical protein